MSKITACLDTWSKNKQNIKMRHYFIYNRSPSSIVHSFDSEKAKNEIFIDHLISSIKNLQFSIKFALLIWSRFCRKSGNCYSYSQWSIRAFRTPSNFPITKEKWSLGHMDEISEVGLLLSRLNLTINWSKVWPKFEFEFSLPLPWLVNSKIFRNYF